jgi:hypothetical protein
VKRSLDFAVCLEGVALVLVMLSSFPAVADITLPAQVPAFNQAYSDEDGYWGDCGLGTYGCTDTIATSGCVITSLAMVLDYYGVELSIPKEFACDNRDHTGMDPGILNDWLKLRGGYGKCGSELGHCCLRWDHLPSQISTTTYVNESEKGLDDEALLVIDQALRNGYPVVCGVHWGEHCNWSLTENEDCHWVVITGKHGSAYEIIDSYDGHTKERQGVRTTLEHGTLGSYTIDRYVVVKGEVPVAGLSDLLLSVRPASGASGNMHAASIKIIGAGTKTPVLVYLRLTDPYGNASYAHFRLESDTLSYSRVRRSLFDGPAVLYEKSIPFDPGYTVDKPGKWIWEVWAEPAASPGIRYGYSTSSYVVAGHVSSLEAGIAVAIVVTLLLAGAVYVINVLSSQT